MTVSLLGNEYAIFYKRILLTKECIISYRYAKATSRRKQNMLYVKLNSQTMTPGNMFFQWK